MRWRQNRGGAPVKFGRAAALAAFAGLIVACAANFATARDEKAAKEEKAASAAQPGNDAQPPAMEGAKHVGFTIRLSLPITDQTTVRVRRFVSGALAKALAQNVRPYLILEFYTPRGQENFAGGSEFESCLKLANYLTLSPGLGTAKTVAYLPQSVQGHAVLVVLACDEIMMAKKTFIGPAVVDRSQIDPTMRAAYSDIPSRRRKFTKDLALGMLDPALQILTVKTEVGTDYVSSDRLEEFKKTHAVIAPEVLKPAGEPLQISSEEARRLGFVSYSPADRRDLAQALDLPPLGIEADPSLENPWRAVRIDLKEAITADKVRQVQKLIEDQTAQYDVNFVCLWIESPGGSPADSSVLANYLATLNPSQVRTVAYIPHEARADAALIAMACDQVVMQPKAVLGGPGRLEIAKDDIQQIKELMRKSLAQQKGRSWSLWAALIDPELEVYRCTRPGEVEYFCNEELAEQLNPAQWQKGEKVTTNSVALRLTGSRAAELRLANRLVADFNELRTSYGLEHDPALIEPGWADNLIEALGSKGVAILLLFIGAAALYFEFHTPGLGIGAFVALVCFVLFFWSQFLNAAPGWLVSLLFLIGLGSLLLEIFVIPGFGIFGLGGGAMIILSLVLASQVLIMPQSTQQVAEMKRQLIMVGGAALALLAAVLMARRWLPNTPLLGRMVLAPPENEELETISRRELLVDLHDLAGARGTTATPLVPAGKARFGDSVVDVIADGEMIEPGKSVEVVEVRGNRVVVREIS